MKTSTLRLAAVRWKDWPRLSWLDTLRKQHGAVATYTDMGYTGLQYAHESESIPFRRRRRARSRHEAAERQRLFSNA